MDDKEDIEGSSPSQTIYIKNINDKIKKDGLIISFF